MAPRGGLLEVHPRGGGRPLQEDRHHDGRRAEGRLPLPLQGGAQGDRQEAGRDAGEGDRHDARGVRGDRGGPSASDARRRPRTGEARRRDPARRIRPGVRRPLLQGHGGDHETGPAGGRQGLPGKQEDDRQLHEVPEIPQPDPSRDGDPGRGPDPDGDDGPLAEAQDAHRPRRRKVPGLRDGPVSRRWTSA